MTPIFDVMKLYTRAKLETFCAWLDAGVSKQRSAPIAIKRATD